MRIELLAEIRQLKAAISNFPWDFRLADKERFSKEALARAAEDFKKSSIVRGEWPTDSNISKTIRNTHYALIGSITK